MKRNRLIVILLLLIIISVTAACGNDQKEKNEVNIGYFPNLTHITTIVALENDYLADAFGEDINLKTHIVNNGGLFMEAMATKSIDVGTVGPGPLINIYAKDPRYHIISGAVNGGAVLVASEHSKIQDLADLDGKKVAIPVIGSTQDVMLRKALDEVGLKPTTNGGTVELFAAAPADTATLFIQQSVDAAATQEPWGHILETKAEGEMLLDWDAFAWGKESTNTVVAASEAFVENEEFVKAYLTAHKQAVAFIQENPTESQKLVQKHLKELTGKEIDQEELEAAFSRLEVTTNVNEQVIQEMTDISKEAEYIQSNNIEGMIQLEQLESLDE